MAKVTWAAGTSGDWLTTSDWSTGALPADTDTAVFGQPGGKGKGSYTVTVGAADVVTVKAINISADNANREYPVLSISGFLTVGSLNYKASVEPTPINVLAGGTLDITKTITDVKGVPETITIAGTGAGGTIILGSPSVSDPDVAIDFANKASGTNKGVLVFSGGYTSGMTVSQDIKDFASGDEIKFANVSFTGDTATYSGMTLTIKSGSATVLTLDNLYAPAGETFTLAGGTITAVCYAAGTRILTATGERTVETLRAGDQVVTLVGDERVIRPVKWVGRRRIDIAKHPRPDAVAPVCIQRGAFADAVPHRDLRVSPDHAILVDGKLVCARQLVNGMTIQQEKDTASVEYFHVELDNHAILLAEGLPAESYLDTGNHGFFANAGEPLTLHPDLTDAAAYPSREAGSVAPFVWDEQSVRPIWQGLADRACALGKSMPPSAFTVDPDLQVIVKGRRAKPLFSQDGLYMFAIPPGTTAVRLVSRASSPSAARPWLEDRRTLGVYAQRIVLRGGNEVYEIPLDHPDLEQGWWGVEREGATMRRWTDGEAVLPLPGLATASILEIRADAGGMEYAADMEEHRCAA